MDSLPTGWLPLLGVVVLLGARHGLDPDHLAAIDGLARFNATRRPRLARWVGCLFSLGHGSVVIVTALAVIAIADRWKLPGWLDAFGSWFSIGFLLLLGLVNIALVLRARPDEIVAPVGFKASVFTRMRRTTSPAIVFATGVLFAVSFDTLTQTALFAMAATRFGGWLEALMLGSAFTAGMLVVDGVNALWIAHLLARADRTARLASRLVGLAVGVLSLIVAGIGVARQLSSNADAWADRHATSLGLAFVLLATVALALSVRLGARRASVRLHADDALSNQET